MGLGLSKALGSAPARNITDDALALSSSFLRQCSRKHTAPGASTSGAQEAFERLSDIVRQASMQPAAATAPLVRELAGANAFVAAHVCQRQGSQVFYQGLKNVSKVRQDECEATLNRCNMRLPFRSERAARLWDAENLVVLPCTSTRTLSDEPDKYCDHVSSRPCHRRCLRSVRVVSL